MRIDPGIIHFANSAAIAARPETWADMVRPGAILYGYHPGFDPMERRQEFESKLPLRPVMSLRARIINVRSVAAGEGVGYNASWVPKRPSRIAVIAAGYHDGVHRSLGNRGQFAIRGHMAPIIGIVSMDVTMLDVTDVPDVTIGDVATLYGEDGDRVYPANVIARVSARSPRICFPVWVPVFRECIFLEAFLKHRMQETFSIHSQNRAFLPN